MPAFENTYYRFPSDNYLGIPNILPFQGKYESCRWIPFNYANTEKHPEECGVHFFIDDNMFERVWTNPYKYVGMLKRFKYVAAPDFSGFDSMPLAAQQFQKFKKHWVARLWQLHGINVIDVPIWTRKCEYDWQFLAEPKNNVVFISSVGTQHAYEYRKSFVNGYNEAIYNLCPRTILFYGNVPEDINTDRIITQTSHKVFAM